MQTERRRSKRVQCLVPVRFYPEGASQAIETLTKDLGTGGLCVFSPVALPSNCHVLAEAVLGSGQTPLSFCARTSWTQTMPFGHQFCIGLQFDHPNEEIDRRLSVYINRLSPQPTA